jgi:hypothetical protein
LKEYKEKVESNLKEMTTLNHQEEDLKWALTTFGSAM